MKKFARFLTWGLHISLLGIFVFAGGWYFGTIKDEMDKGLSFKAASIVVFANLKNQLTHWKTHSQTLNPETKTAPIEKNNAESVILSSSDDVNMCALGFWEAGSPKLLWRCPTGRGAGDTVRLPTEYSDLDSDIKNIALRTIITRIGHRGKTESDWKTIPVAMPERCGNILLSPVFIPRELQGKRFRFEVEGYLIDEKGHKSNTESCVLADTL